MNIGSQIFCLCKLPSASTWLHTIHFQSEENDVNWTTKKISVFHYTITPSKQWECSNCSCLNDLIHKECQVCETVYKTKREKRKK